jgi:hypothetical protein
MNELIDVQDLLIPCKIGLNTYTAFPWLKYLYRWPAGLSVTYRVNHLIMGDKLKKLFEADPSKITKLREEIFKKYTSDQEYFINKISDTLSSHKL